MTRLNQVSVHILLLLVFVGLAALLADYFAADYMHESEFLIYHLAGRISQGAGLVYNSSDHTLPKLSPALPYILSLAVNSARQFSLWFSITSYAISSLILYRVFCRQFRAQIPAMIAVIIWLTSWPLWNGLRSEFGAALLLVMVSLELTQGGYHKLASITQGLAGFFHVTALLPGLFAWVFYYPAQKSRSGLLLLLLPTTILIVFAVARYSHLNVAAYQNSWEWQEWLWLLILVASTVWLIQSAEAENRCVWLLTIWAVGDLAAQIIWTKGMPDLHNPAATVSVAYVIGHLLKQAGGKRRTLVATTGIGLSLAVLSTLHTSDHVLRDLAQGKTIEIDKNASLAHFASDALIYEIAGFTGSVYAFEGEHTPDLAEFKERTDFLSALLLYSPDFLYLEQRQELYFSDSLLQYYEPTDTPNLWERTFSPGVFAPVQPVFISYTPETRIVGYALDKRRVMPGDVLRLRLDWQLVRAPELETGLSIILLDVNGKPVATERRILPPETWANLNPSTVHGIQIDDNVIAGVATVFVAIEYRAGNMGSHPITRVLIPQTMTASPSDQPPIAELGPIALMDSALTVVNRRLSIETVWKTGKLLDTDYQIFLHLLLKGGDGQPIAQADGPPSGGRFPTSFWETAELVRDLRTLNLQAVPPGIYDLRIGYYDQTGPRLTSANGDDSISLGNVVIADDGSILVHLPSSTE